ncbi:MAG: hypothetical protein JW841_18595 [Deltaproteobacteria bacterium]|nr:hypothetical protein [Deltaproteobacteria bacterium]
MRNVKTVTSAFYFTVFLFGIISVAHAEKMQTTGSLSAGTLALGLEFQAGLITGTPLELGLHEMVGLKGGFDLYARQGIQLRDDRTVYLGAGIKWTILTSNRQRPGVALLAGGHYWIDHWAGADGTIIFDYPIGRVTPLVGLDAKLDLPDSGAELRMGLLAIIRISVVTNISWFIEGEIGITGEPKSTFISTGPKITI